MIDGSSSASQEPVGNLTPIKGIDGPVLLDRRTPSRLSNCHHDHTYSIHESPRTVKRKLDKMYEHMSNMKKRLRTIQTKACRLKKTVKAHQNVIKTLKDKSMLSECGLEVLEKTCNVPGELIKRLVKNRQEFSFQ